MNLIKAYDNWPDWFTEYVKRKIAESGNGKFVIEVPPHPGVFGKKSGKALASKIDNTLKELLNE